MACICGSVRTQEEDDLDICPLSNPSPKKPKKRNIFRTGANKTTSNPYSDRGLDKFEALLADLDHKRQEIFTQKGSEDVSMVKFIYRSPDEVKPILVKFQDHRKHDNTSSIETSPKFEHKKDVSFVKGDNGGDHEFEEGKKAKLLIEESTNYMKIKIDQYIRKIGEWWNPSYFFPLFVILILVLLMFSGRSFAILCISTGWYFVPIINETLLHDSKRPKKIVKKEYMKKSRQNEK